MPQTPKTSLGCSPVFFADDVAVLSSLFTRRTKIPTHKGPRTVQRTIAHVVIRNKSDSPDPGLPPNTPVLCASDEIRNPISPRGTIAKPTIKAGYIEIGLGGFADEFREAIAEGLSSGVADGGRIGRTASSSLAPEFAGVDDESALVISDKGFARLPSDASFSCEGGIVRLSAMGEAQSSAGAGLSTPCPFVVRLSSMGESDGSAGADLSTLRLFIARLAHGRRAGRGISHRPHSTFAAIIKLA
jgi:hypothetical protein